MSFDVAKCMERTPEQTKADIESVNLGLNPLNLYSTTDLVAELCRREGVAEITFNRNDSCSSRCYGPHETHKWNDFNPDQITNIETPYGFIEKCGSVGWYILVTGTHAAGSPLL